MPRRYRRGKTSTGPHAAPAPLHSKRKFDSLNTMQENPKTIESIDLCMIEDIHREPDCYIPFMKRNQKTGELENMFTLHKQSLKQYFPAMLKWLVQDAYMGVNSYFRPARSMNKTTGLPDVLRAERHLKYLNAAFVDLDVGRPESAKREQRYPWLDALYLAEAWMEQGEIPQATIYARSGRGLYLLWFLRDAENHEQRPELGPPDKDRAKQMIADYKAINRALVKKLARLAADPGAIDAARVLKVPGTIDKKSGNPVGYWYRTDGHGQPYIYTMEQLTMALGIGAPEPEQLAGGYTMQGRFQGALRQTLNPGTCPNRIAGPIAKNAGRARDMFKIESWQQGFPAGSRRRSLTLLGEFLKYSGAERAKIQALLTEVAKRCRPPYPSEKGDTPVDKIVRGVMHDRARLSRAGDAALLRDYGITEEIARQLNLESIAPPGLKLELKANAKKAEKAEKAAAKLAQRQELKAELKAQLARLIEFSGKHAGCRKLAAAMQDDGYKISYEQVRQLLKEIEHEKKASRAKP